MTEEMTTARMISRERELELLRQWQGNPGASTTILSICGIGGIGKTTLLAQMADEARRAELPALWLDGQSELVTPAAFLNALELGLASAYNRTRPHDVSQLDFVTAELHSRPHLVLADHCEATLPAVYGWLLAAFLPRLDAARVLFVFASRSGLPLRWHTHPQWGPRTVKRPLEVFTRSQVQAYLAHSGLDEGRRRLIGQRSEGHPLLLALTVDLVRSRTRDRQDPQPDIPAALSADFLREAASPTIYRAMTALALLPAADQQLLSALLVEPLDDAAYRDLAQLSCVRQTRDGLVLHPVVAQLLRADWQSRHVSQFQRMRRRAFSLLSDAYPQAQRRRQMAIAAHVLELYRAYLPAASSYADFSMYLPPAAQEPYRPEDLPELLRLLTDSVAGGDWQTEAVPAQTYPALLEELVRSSPGGVFVVRDETARPLAFCAGLELHARTWPLLERYAPGLLDLLGADAYALRRLPPEQADTVLVLLAAVDTDQTLYAPEALGALLLQHWLIAMTRGRRGILATADPQLNALLPQLGFTARGTLGASGMTETATLTGWEIDFREERFPAWIARIVRQTDHTPLAPQDASARSDTFAAADPVELSYGQDATMPSLAGIRPAQTAVATQPDVASAFLSWREVQTLLKQLFEPGPHHRSLALPGPRTFGPEALAQLEAILTMAEPPYPLTAKEQAILREIYLRRTRNKNELAEHFHVSRATLYRQTRTALQHLAHVVNRNSG
ncbi:bacterio-opsin activator [Paenibacillus sp. IB182496]|uniref:Bacterio-opsin activator n=1 Tax=Paenibacillus sabuli TaxID=2772509 RepID=A0A927GR85_9BACL|nr:bacterio-opsin activator [Paenibacillus sabuli]MBD2845354.1 bacterio-opsin activator [Paenibacillus sabuli]